ncbi:MAG: phosphatase PAP2 family protein [Bacteroidales bacterium]|jgi:undecaprenyl-diphosphatase|nr:phosphatase PAP2 family protein [Bacteroidales bacterium]MDD2264166.1 phosphatase PAP2 family protein [Bacteroidales bacterium]MDD2831363.1 phosphatase PAP2 family protein [Bacteroidales bacterium]MDD3208357.1 phosphatase PAP2 family protein [Bacteroidales bacterium]MDD3696960.1 phosphatase PAP2 family protein [Bacteroidales bacterium]
MEHLVESIITLDHKLFFIINGAHCDFLDPVMKLFSNIPVWIPLYLLIAGGFFLILPWRYALTAILGIILTFLLTDQVSSSLIKDWVQRLRPSYIAEWDGMFRLLEDKGGLYSFVSSHASNVFGLACFTSLAYRRRWYTISIFLWATLVSYSRIYVGKHFPLDVICGAIIGLVLGWIVFMLFKLIKAKIESRCAV